MQKTPLPREIPRPDRAPPVTRFGPAGLFFLRIVRLMATGGIDDARATAALFAQFGRNHRRPLVLIRALVLEMSRVSNRRIVLAPPCCGRITADEAIMLSALGRGEEGFAKCHADSRALLDSDSALGAATCFQAVAACFADLGAPFNRLSPFAPA
ncbi:MAG: DUF6628 family protein [Sphingobium sp.]